MHISESIDTLRYIRTALISFSVDLFSDLRNSLIIDMSFCRRGLGVQSPSIFIESFVLIRKRIKDWIQGAYT